MPGSSLSIASPCGIGGQARVLSDINPATAAKGLNILTDDGLLEKRRGIGMFVADGARQQLLDERRQRFAERYVDPLVAEASRLGIGTGELVDLINKSSHEQGGVTT
jgi:DNA-binding transcriptional regulator YhcF (GntR family)